MPTTLTTTERHDLATLERTIERGLEVCLSVGKALMEIKDRKLYRHGFPTFEGYCQARWKFTRQRAYQYINGAKTIESLSTIVDNPPANEAQARELGKLPPAEQPEAWETVVENAGGVENVTAGDVRQEVERRTRQPEHDAEAAEEEESEEDVVEPEVITEPSRTDLLEEILLEWLDDTPGMGRPHLATLLEPIGIWLRESGAPVQACYMESMASKFGG